MRRAFLETPDGQIHYRTAGEGPPVLLLHQTPRSSDEYRDAIPLLARDFRVIAMDTLGYGDSYKPARLCTIEDYAQGALNLLDGLGIRHVSLVGHHTGAVIAIELAASRPDRIARLVASASPLVNAAAREARKRRPPIDEVTETADGHHLTELWQRRQAFYPANRPDLLTRYVIDALKASEKVEEGHRAVSIYHMEDKLGRIRCPTLFVCGTDDPFSYPQMGPLARHIAGSQAVPIPGGTVALVDQIPEAFVRAIRDFLRTA